MNQVASKFHIVVAVDSRNGIGKSGLLPWKLSGDMAFFKRLTSQVSEAGKRNAVIMGRKTWDSIPLRFRPLGERLNIVISRQSDLVLPAGVTLAGSLDDALLAARRSDIDSIFVIGGGAIYAEAYGHPALDCVYLTQVVGDFKCDTFFPSMAEKFAQNGTEPPPACQENGIEYAFQVFTRKLEHDSKNTGPLNGICAQL